MNQIKIIENPFNFGDPAWEDPLGRIGIRVGQENSVKWYNMTTDSGRSYLLDEVTMIIDQPFHDSNSPIIMEI